MTDQPMDAEEFAVMFTLHRLLEAYGINPCLGPVMYLREADDPGEHGLRYQLRFEGGEPTQEMQQARFPKLMDDLGLDLNGRKEPAIEGTMAEIYARLQGALSRATRRQSSEGRSR